MGFYISKLSIQGPNVQPAELNFSPGFNIIDGPSNTGKSYIQQCLDYMTGGQDLPEPIPEAAGYTHLYLEIIDDQKQIHCIKRDFSGGDCLVAKASCEAFDSANQVILKAKHYKENENTLSRYLLNLCDFGNVYLKKNKYNEKRTLSFRDIARLTIIEEVEIIKKLTPITTSRKPTTEEVSVFYYLLTGQDFATLITKEKPEIRKEKIAAQIDLIDILLSESSHKTQPSEIPEVKLGELQNRIDDVLFDIDRDVSLRFNLETMRREKWELLQKVDSERILEEEIAKRFEILKEQYEKDIERLEFLDEGNELLSYLTISKCPLCGRSEEHSHAEIDSRELNINDITTAIKVEYRKIFTKREDLVAAIDNVNKSIQLKYTQSTDLNDEISYIDTQIFRQLDPSIKFQKGIVQNLIEEQRKLISANASINELQLNRRKEELEKQLRTKDTSDADTGISTEILKAFTDIVSSLLKAWKYSEKPFVYFDSKKKDLNIDGHPRSSDGKGYRAITYSAFVIGLMRYCLSKNLGHSGVVVLDSPLTAYKKSDYSKDDEISVDIENAFFEDLCKTPENQQIIVLDNKSLSSELQKGANYVHFTRNPGLGRYGFFPQSVH